jgi:predicted dehydrogenase
MCLSSKKFDTSKESGHHGKAGGTCMERLQMGLLGCSGHYALRVATPLKSSLLVEPYAVASRDAVKARNFAKIWDFTVSYGSFEELLADSKAVSMYGA